MTPALCTARLCTTAATVLGLCAVQAGTQGQWLFFGLTVYGAAFLAWCAACERRHHRWILTRHENARRAALLEELDTAVPCCRLAEHSDGRAHGRDCRRRPPDLDATCCELWWTSAGADHDDLCHVHRRAA